MVRDISDHFRGNCRSESESLFFCHRLSALPEKSFVNSDNIRQMTLRRTVDETERKSEENSDVKDFNNTSDMHKSRCSAMENKDTGQSNINSVITFDTLNKKLDNQFLRTERIRSSDVKDSKDMSDTRKTQCPAMDNKGPVQSNINSAVSFDPLDREVYNRRIQRRGNCVV